MSANILTAMQEYDHEEVVVFQDKDVGLKAIIAIHNTVLGPALGGTRMWPYATEGEAMRDALRLSRAMTYKAAAAGLNLGGGKAVIIGDPKKDKSQTLFSVYGRFLNTLGGRYITAEDVGTDVNDIEYMFTETDYVVGIEASHGGSGDPSPFTALGVFQGIQACCNKVFGSDDVRGRTVVVQGVGSVGSKLARLLVGAGARLIIADVDPTKAELLRDELGATIASPEETVEIPCDIFAPCALGSVINNQTVGKLRCKIVAGGANNQLERVENAEWLRQHGILYAPDYVINAGGLMNVYLELEGYSRERAERMTRGIYYNLMQIFQISDRGGISTATAVDHMVERRLEKVGRASAIFMPHRKDILEKIRLRRRS